MPEDQTTMTIYLTREDKAQVETWAKEDERSVSSLIRRWISSERARRTTQLPLAVELSPKDSPAADMRANGAQEFSLDKAA